MSFYWKVEYRRRWQLGWTQMYWKRFREGQIVRQIFLHKNLQNLKQIWSEMSTNWSNMIRKIKFCFFRTLLALLPQTRAIQTRASLARFESQFFSVFWRDNAPQRNNATRESETGIGFRVSKSTADLVTFLPFLSFFSKGVFQTKWHLDSCWFFRHFCLQLNHRYQWIWNKKLHLLKNKYFLSAYKRFLLRFNITFHLTSYS